MKFTRVVARLLLILLLSPISISAQDLTSYSYDLGSPSVVDYYIDPINGSDSKNGTSPSTAWRTVQHAWGTIPESTTLTQGYRFNLMNGIYGNDELPNYWELKQGTATFPIILRAATDQTAVNFVRDINMANVSYFYLVGVNITPTGGGDAFHCEGCNHLLIRGCTLNGGSTSGGAHETVKINQSQYVYLENNNISNADDNNIDFVAVQYGHVIGNKIHDALDWCVYAKGGSAYLRFESNEISNCGTGGFTAGQGSGFQFMTSPWIHYEAYDMKFINNIVHDTEGAAFGVNGGYNVLIAHNTAYKVGTRDHLVEVVFGERTCDGSTEGAAESTCSTLNGLGGWGSGQVHLTAEPIGNKNIFILNNVIYNPSGVNSAQHFAIYGPRTPASGTNIPSPQTSDTNLVIKGNIIWNNVGSAILGIEDSEQGCQSGNPSCSQSQLTSENSINTIEPALIAPSTGDFRPSDGGNILSATSATLASFAGGDRVSTPLAPEGTLSNTFLRDFSGASASSARIVGAFNSATASTSPPAIEDSETPGDPAPTGPTIASLHASAKMKQGKANVSIIAMVSSSSTISSVKAVIKKGSKTLKRVTLKLSNSAYRATSKVAAKKRNQIKITTTAVDGNGSDTSSVTVRVK